MTDRPILFSAPMVLALLAGRKTQTRRLAWRDKVVPMRDGGDMVTRAGPSSWQRAKPGDRLWGRESYCRQISGSLPTSCHYRADGEHVVLDDGDGFTATNRDGSEKSPWRPSIHMPRWASRLTLTVTDVRVQRLQEISEQDAVAEGVTMDDDPFWRPTPADPDSGGRPSCRNSFEFLWGHLHGPDAWAANPEVVALSFQCERRNIDR